MLIPQSKKKRPFQILNYFHSNLAKQKGYSKCKKLLQF